MKPCPTQRSQLGFGLVELMVGITVGMFVVAGACMMMSGQLAEHRRLMLETQVQQDLRASADLMLRELRRAGFWATPERGVWAPDASSPQRNVYAATTPGGDAQSGSQVLYSYSRASDYSTPAGGTPASAEDQVLADNEAFGFRLSNKVLQMLLGGAWQPLTDPNTVSITAFSVRLSVRPLSLQGYCSKPCPAGAGDCPPQQQIRRFDIEITGQARHDPKVVRSVSLSSRVRNDQIIGSCPA